MQEFIRRIQRSYPQIYGACHVRHVRAATTEHGVSARDSAILAHFDEHRPLRAADLAAHLGKTESALTCRPGRAAQGHTAAARAGPPARPVRPRWQRLRESGIAKLP